MAELETITLDDGEIYVLFEDVDFPDWLDDDLFTIREESLDPNEDSTQYLQLQLCKDVVQGGCASGSYMPAVTYWQAMKVMQDHGNDVLDYIQQQLGDEYPQPPKDASWQGIACHYLSMACELWCSSMLSQVGEDC